MVDAQNHIGIFGIRPEMRCANATEFSGREAEYVGHALEEDQFARVQDAIGLGDFEQPIKNVFQNRRLFPEHTRDLRRIRLEARRVLTSKVEDAPHVCFLGRRHAKNAGKGADFIIGNPAVGLGHLGAKRDDRHREGYARFRLIGTLLIEEQMAGNSARQSADRAAPQKETCRRATHFSPNGHGWKH